MNWKMGSSSTGFTPGGESGAVLILCAVNSDILTRLGVEEGCQRR